MSKANHIVEAISAQISQSILSEGEKLPSLRLAAQEFGVSKNTVVEAYERLVALGFVQARRGSGFFVTPLSHVRHQDPPAHMIQAVDQISLLRAQLNQNYEIRVGDGRPPASWLRRLTPRRSFMASSDLIAESAAYGSPKGYRLLRDLIVGRYTNQGISVSQDQVMTTFGANHGLDLIIRRLLTNKDIVLVDDPGYYPLFAKLKLAQVHYVGVRRTSVGPDIDDLRSKIEAHRPTMFFTQSLGQNPTGSSIDLPTSHSVLSLAEEHNMLIVDDDPFTDLPNMKGVRLAALDQCKNVICVGTFSKTMSASFRAGYVVGPSEIIQELAELKMITTVNSSRFSEIIIADMIQSGRYQKHLNSINRRIEDAAHSIEAEFNTLELETHSSIGNGYYSYLFLPAGLDDLQLAQTAAEQGIFLAPGSVFSVSGACQERPTMRINLARANEKRFFQFMKEVVN